MKIFISLFILFSLAVSAAPKSESGVIIDDKNKIKYKYKKYQKFDFEDMVIEGETGSPGDLSIVPRYQTKFKNRLPYRKNFNAEIRKGIERIR
jgi:predicted amidohydrolase